MNLSLEEKHRILGGKGAVMEIGFIGLGKMGMKMVTRLRQGDHRVIAFDRSQDLIKQAEGTGTVGASSLQDLISKLAKPARRMGDGAIWHADRRNHSNPCRHAGPR